MKVRKITKFEFVVEETDSAHDVEFIPSEDKRGVFDVWVDGVMVEEMGPDERPSLARAMYYFDTHCAHFAARVEEAEDGFGALEAAPVH